MKTRRRGGLFAASLALVVAGSAGAQTDAGAPAASAVGAWLVACVDEALETVRCEAAQRVVDEDGQLQILSASILAGRDAPPTEIVFTTPLGVWLEPGAVLALPANQSQGRLARQLAFERCAPSGCVLHVALDDELRLALAGGGVAELRFADRLKQPLAAPVALDGLEDALVSLEERTAPPKPAGFLSWFPWLQQ
jgi:invasion protein IalB